MQRHRRQWHRARGARRFGVMLAAMPLLGACGGADTTSTAGASSNPAMRYPSGVVAPSPTVRNPKPPSEWPAWPADETSVGPAIGTTASSALPLPSPSAPVKPGDNRVYVLGDSVLVGAKAELPAAMIGWRVTVDSVESRFITQGIGIVKTKVAAIDRERAAAFAVAVDAALADGLPEPPAPARATIADAIGRVVVINLCTNYGAGGGFDSWVVNYMGVLKDLDRVVWVTCNEWSAGQTEANLAVRTAAPKYGNVVVADWALYADQPGYTYTDKIHLDQPGRGAMADLVARAVGPYPGPGKAPPSSASTSTSATTTTVADAPPVT